MTADIKTATDLNLDTPRLVERPDDGKREARTVIVAASPETQSYIAELAERADRVRARAVDPDVDNMLKIFSDGRAAALDLQLVGHPSTATTKVQVAAEQIATIYTQHRDDTYPDAGGGPDPARGSLQLVFCDLGTPKPDRGWSVYGELRDELARHGVPREMVRFIHDARTDREKGELFAACRAGHVAVLIGSTERMGVGTNVQRRAVALHHLDCPWRPADLAQRDGRIIRQGNINPEVQILRYVTEGSFDAYSWQTVARKAQFIAQVMRGRLDTREIEDIGDTALSYNEVKALATGNPLLLDHAQATTELTRLERLARGHDRAQRRLPDLIASSSSRLARLSAQRQTVAQALLVRRPTRAAAFSMTIGGRRCVERAEAKQQLISQLSRLREGARDLQLGETVALDRFAQLGGLDLSARAWRSMTDPNPRIGVAPHGLDGTEIALTDNDWTSPAAGLITRIENQLASLESLQESIDADIVDARAEIERGTAQLDKPFPRAAALAQARAQLAGIERLMAEQAAPPTPEPEPPVAPDEPDTRTEAHSAAPPPHPARLAALGFASPHPGHQPAGASQAAHPDRPRSAGRPGHQREGLER